MTIRTLCVVLVGLALGSSAAAQPVDTTSVDLAYWSPCDEGDYDGDEFMACVSWLFAEADAELNAVYQAAHAALRADPELGSASGLRAAQRAWITFRDADCEDALSSHIWTYADYDGPWRAGRIVYCKTVSTRLRTAQLRYRFVPQP